MRRFITLFQIFLFAGFALSAHAAVAQDLSVGAIGGPEEPKTINPYDPKYRPQVQAYSRSDSMIPSSRFWLYFPDSAGTNADEVRLDIFQPTGVSGCMSIDMPEPDVRVSGTNMWVSIARPTLNINKDPESRTSCQGDHARAATHITLNRNSDVRTIAFKSEGGVDYYDVESSPSHIRLVPRSTRFFKPFKQPGRIDGLLHWFYPKNTLVLSVPGIKEEDDLRASVEALAKENGLRPIESVIQDFDPPVNTLGTWYFVDKKGTTAAKANKEQRVVLGTVTRMETYYGPTGSYQKPKKLEVLARKP